MKTLFIALLVLSTSSFAYKDIDEKCEKIWQEFNYDNKLPEKYKSANNLCNERFKKELITAVRRRYSSVSYKQAKKIMFSSLDNERGKVCSVYSDHCLTTTRIPNHRVMNAEHTWPKSKGAKQKPAVSDMHHLFPCNSQVNSIRSSYPFCETDKVEWTNGMSSLGKLGRNGKCFVPPVEHRGNVARSMFYFSIRYNKKIDSTQEKWFRKWHNDDPVDQKERDRNKAISRIQKNTNPFVDYPFFVDLIQDF